jgi:hypothetical protein
MERMPRQDSNQIIALACHWVSACSLAPYARKLGGCQSHTITTPNTEESGIGVEYARES